MIQHSSLSIRTRSVTWRAVLIGLIGSLIIAVGAPYGTYRIRGSYMALDFSTPGAMALFFILVALLNGLWRRLSRRTALQAGELIVSYIMMIIASAIPTMGLTAQLLPLISTPFYYANETNRWARLIQPMLNRSLVPRDPEAIRQFYEGAPGRAIPWDVWIPPLLAWLPLLIALYLVMICLMVILRRQWVERERLAYPLTQLPLEMVNEREPLLRNWALWMGFSIAFGFSSLIGLHSYFPWIPGPRWATTVHMFRDTMTLSLRLSFPMLGFFYLINLDTAFSVWFFNLLFFFIQGVLSVLGVDLKENLGAYGTPYGPYKYLGAGAMFVLVLGGLWVAWPHLKEVLRKALGRGPEVDDSREILSYPVAFWGVVVGLIGMSVWLTWSGLPFWGAWLYLLFAFVFFIGLTRVVVESGLAEAVASTISSNFIVGSFGSLPFGSRGLVALGLTYAYSADIRTIVMTSVAHGLKMADVVGANRRSLFWVSWLAILASLGASVYVTLVWAYHYGGANLNGWFFIDGPQYPFKWVADNILNPSDISGIGWVLTGLGSGLMVFLTLMRQRFYWWPFHPIGFCIGSVWIMNELWLVCFCAWLFKVLILRYGGLRLFRQFRPLFLGFILGQFTCNALWLIIDGLTGHTGNQIFWI